MPAIDILRIHLASNAVTVTVGDDTASSPVETRVRQPVWLEQRSDDWWTALTAAIAELRLRADLYSITAIDLSRDLRGWVLLDGEPEPIRPAILSDDERARDGPPLQWLRANETIAYKRIQHILTPKGYLRFRLTGEIAADAEDAADIGLLDPATGRWSEARCDDLEINIDLLPILRDTHEPLPLLESAGAGLGLVSRITVVG